MRIIIAGSRSFNDYLTLAYICDDIIRKEEWDELEIVSGGAKGADKLGEVFAKDRDYKLTVFPANWDTHGKKAGYLRNQEMAYYSDALIAFWDGKSKGTKNMINIARERALAIHVHET